MKHSLKFAIVGVNKGFFTNDCKTSFSSKRRPEALHKIIFEDYFLHRQTLKQLVHKYDRSIRWIMKQRDEYIVDYKEHNPRPVNLICDATFYGKQKDKLETLVFKDNETKEILIWKHIESEFVKDYKSLKEELQALGYMIQSATLDGRRGLYKAYNDIPIQMCTARASTSLPSKKDCTEVYHDEIKT
ncbi:MAG: hypothetical protein L3I99_02980 [Sulfurimonas sp.]|nr:hypothetical protein [Sulfurimonas sp.]